MPQQPSGTVTFLFTDIEGSTQLWEHHGQAMAAALERHDTLVREIIEDHEGYIFKVVGDAFCAAFDTASSAISAAVETQRALTKEDWATFGDGFPLMRIRMALHTGETQERGQDYFGAPVNRVARLESAANGGQILMTAATERIVREQLPSEATIRDLGQNRLKDLRYAEHIFQLLAPGMPDVTSDLRTGGAVLVENPAKLELPPGAEPILSRLFHDARRVVIESELAGGFSGSRVFKATPYDAEDKRELAAVVKLAPAGLATQEYEAYQARIRGKLSGIPEIWGRPAYAEGGRWAGIRYALVGGELFDIQSLRRYWGRAELSDLVHVLESRLFVHLGAMWRQSEPQTLAANRQLRLPASGQLGRAAG